MVVLVKPQTLQFRLKTHCGQPASEKPQLNQPFKLPWKEGWQCGIDFMNLSASKPDEG
jgi:hypothetical protein